MTDDTDRPIVIAPAEPRAIEVPWLNMNDESDALLVSTVGVVDADGAHGEIRIVLADGSCLSISHTQGVACRVAHALSVGAIAIVPLMAHGVPIGQHDIEVVAELAQDRANKIDADAVAAARSSAADIRLELAEENERPH